MKIIATDFHTYLRPSKCDLRVYLRHNKVEESEPGPFEQVIRTLGQRHEKAHLQTLRGVLDLSSYDRLEREHKTIDAVKAGIPVIYQGVLTKSVNINGTLCEVTGDPDYLIYSEGNYIIRDSKMSRNITEKDHPEILRQLFLYGWLYEQVFGSAPAKLEIHSGTNQIVEVTNSSDIDILAELGNVLRMKLLTREPYSPVGYSKCGGCGYHDYCWPRAEQNNDVAIINGVDQSLAIKLRSLKVHSYQDLLQQFDKKHLSELKRPWGTNQQKVGKNAKNILLAAHSMNTKKEILLEAPVIPKHSNYVMFDLEGLPPYFDELEKIYLWGMQVFGESPSEFMPATGGFGDNGDKECWGNFLKMANSIFTKYGDIPFVHWANYEKTKINLYIDRFGDTDGIAARVLRNLLNLLPITEKSIVLPLPSYSLKVVEKYVGFKRSQTEYGGDWSIAQYIEATETEDEQLRNKVMNEILIYNREDLEATWAVFQWLRLKSKC